MLPFGKRNVKYRSRRYLTFRAYEGSTTPRSATNRQSTFTPCPCSRATVASSTVRGGTKTTAPSRPRVSSTRYALTRSWKGSRTCAERAWRLARALDQASLSHTRSVPQASSTPSSSSPWAPNSVTHWLRRRQERWSPSPSPYQGPRSMRCVECQSLGMPHSCRILSRTEVVLGGVEVAVTRRGWPAGPTPVVLKVLRRRAPVLQARVVPRARSRLRSRGLEGRGTCRTHPRRAPWPPRATHGRNR